MIDWKHSDDLTRIANDLEEARKKIYVHSKTSRGDYIGVDDKLFKFQSDIRQIAEIVQDNETLEQI